METEKTSDSRYAWKYTSTPLWVENTVRPCGPAAATRQWTARLPSLLTSPLRVVGQAAGLSEPEGIYDVRVSEGGTA